ncbi:DUF3310 domain-containing protein [Rhodococcus hoagii]|nr:DUF3310 domain-containing protein [Prescottella equi]
MSDSTADPVNHPGHYTSHPSGVECIQVTEHMSFCLGNAIKYIWRADLKGNAIEDLQKARWYVDREIARLGGEPAVLDRLAADGRLLPEGGAVPDVKPIGWYRTMTPRFAAEHFDFPTPTAEKHVAEDGGKWVFDGQLEQWELREYPPAVRVPDDAPDGTPEKPWPNLNEVPADVQRVQDSHEDVWTRDGDGWSDGETTCYLDECRDGHPEFAPFVRVDGGKA